MFYGYKQEVNICSNFQEVYKVPHKTSSLHIPFTAPCAISFYPQHFLGNWISKRLTATNNKQITFTSSHVYSIALCRANIPRVAPSTQHLDVEQHSLSSRHPNIRCASHHRRFSDQLNAAASDLERKTRPRHYRHLCQSDSMRCVLYANSI